MNPRIERLEAAAPDVVGTWRVLDGADLAPARARLAVAREPGSTARIVAQATAAAGVLADIVAGMPEASLRLPGGEADWNVAQAVGHTAEARAGLVLAASFAASGRWPADASPVVPGVPGDAGASREVLLRRIATSQRIVERAARSIDGHESDPCPLDHPIVGRLCCGEWLLFAAVHDLLHVEQLERLERLEPREAGA